MAFIFICYCKSLLQSFPEAANQRCSANRMLSISSKIHKYQLYFLQGPFLTYTRVYFQPRNELHKELFLKTPAIIFITLFVDCLLLAASFFNKY